MSMSENEASLDDNLVSPMLHSHLDETVQAIFEELFFQAYELPWNGAQTEEEIKGPCEEYNNRLIAQVTEHPMLARAVHEDLLKWSLLNLAVEKLYREWSHRAIKFLIEQNPSALLWKRADFEKEFKGNLIFAIAKHHAHNRLMPWIAENYPWVLNHVSLEEFSPTLTLVETYTRGGCDASSLRRFFEAYPKGISDSDEFWYKIVIGHEECDAGLFVWMAEQAPDSLLVRHDNYGTVLHCACVSLDKNSSDNIVEIIRYLLKNYQQFNRELSGSGCLPIHHLTREKTNLRHVQEVMLMLLRDYPASFDMSSSRPSLWRTPNQVPFLQKVKPLLDQQLEFENSVAFLQSVHPDLGNATACTLDPTIREVSDIVVAWSKARIADLETKLEALANTIEGIRKEFEEQTQVDSDESDDESW